MGLPSLMRAIVAILLLALSGRGSPAATVEERVTMPARDGATELVGEVVRPPGGERRPALVLLHGCSGLGPPGRPPFGVYRGWSRILAERGYVVLLLDSAGSRGLGQTCTAGEGRRGMWRDRPRDAYAGLAFLQAQPFVRPDRVGLVGWSQGGGVVLLSIAARSSGRPTPPPAYDFRAAVAFYPGACSDRRQSQPYTLAPRDTWTTTVPLLVLQGEADNWTPAEPCRQLMGAAASRGAPVEFKSYPNAHHSFDGPGNTLRERPEYGMETGIAPIVGPEPAARADAFVRVPDFLDRHLRD